MKVIERACGCFELRIGSTRLLLDYSAGDAALLRYLPSVQGRVSAAADAWSCVKASGHWLVDGQVRLVSGWKVTQGTDRRASILTGSEENGPEWLRWVCRF